jgi:hypothetical protein
MTTVQMLYLMFFIWSAAFFSAALVDKKIRFVLFAVVWMILIMVITVLGGVE